MEQEPPDGWHLWLLFLKKFAVADLPPLTKIRAIANCLSGKQILHPCGIAVDTKKGINYIRSQDPSLEWVGIIWQSAKSWIGYIGPPRTKPPIASADQVLDLISSIKAETIDLSRISIDNRQKRQLDLPENYDRLTPAGKPKQLPTYGPLPMD